jgi:hypothetical protein
MKAPVLLIRILHAALVGFVVLIPLMPTASLNALFLGLSQWSLTGAAFILAYHALVVAMLLGHWALSDDTCALTMLEQTLRGCPASMKLVPAHKRDQVPAHCGANEGTFVGSIVSPVYKIPESVARRYAWIPYALLGALGAVSLGRILLLRGTR